MEGTETANVAASGMGCHNLLYYNFVVLGDHIVSSHYDIWWNYAFLKNFYS
jgi:methionine-gamma-lyase